MSSQIFTIAIDAMGGDTAPAVPVEGALAALDEMPDISITLVGDEVRVVESLDTVFAGRNKRSSLPGWRNAYGDRLVIVHAPETIGMGESPAQAIRSKKGSSLVLANMLCRDGQADAVISAGSTGAAMTASLLYMGRLKGVLRPAICGLIPSETNLVALLDMGANPDCKPENLYQFAVMASLYVSHVLGCEKPRVGLLSIGEERTKGNELTISAHELLDASDLNFIGNVEGRDIFKGVADVVVCDGFVGNVLLKFGESVFGFVAYKIREKLERSMVLKAGAFLMKPVFSELKKDMSPEDYGGAPLLGVDGVSIICHGNSTPEAIRNAVKVARQLVLEKVNDQIKTELARKHYET